MLLSLRPAVALVAGLGQTSSFIVFGIRPRVVVRRWRRHRDRCRLSLLRFTPRVSRVRLTHHHWFLRLWLMTGLVHLFVRNIALFDTKVKGQKSLTSEVSEKRN